MADFSRKALCLNLFNQTSCLIGEERDISSCGVEVFQTTSTATVFQVTLDLYNFAEESCKIADSVKLSIALYYNCFKSVLLLLEASYE